MGTEEEKVEEQVVQGGVMGKTESWREGPSTLKGQKGGVRRGIPKGIGGMKSGTAEWGRVDIPNHREVRRIKWVGREKGTMRRERSQALPSPQPGDFPDTLPTPG